MAKVTSKLQFTIPKALAVAYGIRPGDEIELRSDGPYLRLIPPGSGARELTVQEKLARFDETTRHLQSLWAKRARQTTTERGWTREDAYEERLARWRR
jgi:bifunctional DNA-binding transcriptional regulator/antitoxin component of YhaV-PrlF toxin-antitoxin module